MYWHSWNEGICQTRFQELACTSTKPSYNPEQITQVVSLKQGSKCTTYYINSYGKVLDIACKSQIKTHHTPGHQPPLNCQVLWDPQDRSQKQRKAPLAKHAHGQLQHTHSQQDQGVAQHPQTTEIRGSTKQWSQPVLQASQHPGSCKKRFAKAQTS